MKAKKITSEKSSAIQDELTEVTIFDQFGKGEKLKNSRTNNCVIYTRVSSREQELGYSLDTQRKDCEEFARNFPWISVVPALCPNRRHWCVSQPT